jgi:hypothetical protein
MIDENEIEGRVSGNKYSKIKRAVLAQSETK